VQTTTTTTTTIIIIIVIIMVKARFWFAHPSIIQQKNKEEARTVLSHRHIAAGQDPRIESPPAHTTLHLYSSVISSA
jgi:hypothetical protein